MKRASAFWRACRKRAFAGIGWHDLEARLELERRSICRLVDRHDRALASHARLVDWLMMRIRALEREELALRSRTAVHTRVGSRAGAATLVVELQAVRRELDSSRGHLGQAAITCESLLEARALALAAARARIESFRRGSGARLAAQALAEIERIGAADRCGQTLERLRNMLVEGRATDGIAVGGDAERLARAKALDEFLAEEGGLVVEITAPATIARDDKP